MLVVLPYIYLKCRQVLPTFVEMEDVKVLSATLLAECRSSDNPNEFQFSELKAIEGDALVDAAMFMA